MSLNTKSEILRFIYITTHGLSTNDFVVNRVEDCLVDSLNPSRKRTKVSSCDA